MQDAQTTSPPLALHILERAKFHIGCLASIPLGPLPSALKRKVLATQLRLYRQIFLQPKKKTCRIVDFDFSFYSLPLLQYLFREVFVDPDYCFEARRPSPVILDCGCNIGMSICFFKSLFPGCKIMGFEPAADSFALLTQNVQANGLKDVALHQAALGSSDGEVTFYQENDPGSLMASTNAHRVGGRTQTVQQVRLSSFIDGPVDFMKLDVEGAEDEVLKDLVKSNKLRHIEQMVIEYHHHVDKDTDAFAGFLATLESGGFGYQMRAKLSSSKAPGEFQDIVLYAYRKG